MTIKNDNTTTNYDVVAQREGINKDAIPVVDTAELVESRATQGDTTHVWRDSNDLTYATAVRTPHLPAQLQILEDSPTTPALLRTPSTVVEAPKGMKVTRPGHQDEPIVIIERKWPVHCICFQLFFIVVWNGFMLFWNFIAISSGAWPMVLLGLLHDFAGIIMIVGLLTALLNSTFVTVENGVSSFFRIVVEDRPMFGKKKTFLLNRNTIQEVCCKRNVNVDSERNVTVTYDVRHIGAHSGEHDVIVGDLPSLEEALFFAQEIQFALGVNVIADGQLIV